MNTPIVGANRMLLLILMFEQRRVARSQRGSFKGFYDDSDSVI